MNNIFTRTICAILAIGWSVLIYADSTLTGVQVEDAYARAVAPGQANSAAYMVLNNTGTAAQVLIAAHSPIANAVELHTHSMDGGVMRMHQVDKIAVPAGERVVLQPGGLHIMLIGLIHTLVPEEQFPVTLMYENGASQTVQVVVRGADGAHQQHRHH